MANRSTPPVLKAWGRVFELLKCIHDNSYNRAGFERAVLDLYESDYSKSVFRGMAIPTLRNLGFILGFGEDIRISANGTLIYLAFSKSIEEGQRALRAVLKEMDENVGVLSFLENTTSYPVDELIETMSQEISITDARVINKPQSQKRAAKERLLDWIKFLTYSQLLYSSGKAILLDQENLMASKTDTNPTSERKRQNFNKLLIPSYRKIVVGQKGVGTVEIEELRKEVSSRLYDDFGEILTNIQFDNLFTEFPKTTDDYIISLGLSMGADEKLFNFQGKYYQTLIIRYLH